MIMILIVNDNNTHKIIIKKKTPTPFWKKILKMMHPLLVITSVFMNNKLSSFGKSVYEY